MNLKESQEILIQDLGFKKYKSTLSLQKKMQKQRIAGNIKDTLILVEHEPVYTLGKNANRHHLLQGRDKSVEVYNIERGGDVTFHGHEKLHLPLFQCYILQQIYPYLVIDDVYLHSFLKYTLAHAQRGSKYPLYSQQFFAFAFFFAEIMYSYIS